MNGNDTVKKGYVQVYTGTGKGKTTAALGLALRAVGAGLKVFFAQFIKGRFCSEITAIERYADQITFKQYGRGCFIYGNPDEADIAAGREGLEDVRKALQTGRYDVVVLDEANTAVHLGLFSADDLLSVIDAAGDNVEIVITGRNVPRRILDRADLVTEMMEVKHYHRKGVKARKGIEE